MNSFESAQEILKNAVIYFKDQPIGTVASSDSRLEAVNYSHCFVRDFFPGALVFLMQGDYGIVKNFLATMQGLQAQQTTMEGHKRAPGLMPASFKIKYKEGREELRADFGERAIGRVAPVDSAMWWMILLALYSKISGDQSLRENDDFQTSIKEILDLYLKESFETSPAMLVPDGCFMIDRRMGVYGHPLEIQALLFAMLRCSKYLLLDKNENHLILAMVEKRLQALRSYMRIYYWLDKDALNKIHRFRSEEFGLDVENVLNIFPESIPAWLDGWMDEECGYLVGNLGAGRMDFRFFALGNLLSILFDVLSEQQSQMIMNLYQRNWQGLVGEMPAKIVYPALVDQEWALLTGCDAKNAPWSYHNGGNWPVLLWTLVAASIQTGREDIAQSALDIAERRLQKDNWPEYYDGKAGSLVGRRANYCQNWTCSAYLLAYKWVHEKKTRSILQDLKFSL